MKILWLTESPSKYKRSQVSYNGRGWIESLQEMIELTPDVDQLGIAFPHPSDHLPLTEGKVTYLPIRSSVQSNSFLRIIERWKHKIEEPNEIEELRLIINSFQPDIIHIFGTESWLCHATSLTKIPCVIHLQGLLLPYVNTYLPYNTGEPEIFTINLSNTLRGIGLWHSKKLLEKKAKRESLFFKQAYNYMGRTQWDKEISKFLAPKSNYFHVNEVLRQPFYQSYELKKQNGEKCIIYSTVSDALYKGLDVIIKTADLLVKENFKFEWRVIGIKNNNNTAELFEKKYNTNFESLCIKLLGVLSADEIVTHLIKSDLYVHSSYIDNSPNSLCEAQLLGVPVIGCNAGGVSSLINDNETGILVPANDPYYYAAQIVSLYNNRDKREKLGTNGKIAALDRHNKISIIESIIACYRTIVTKT